MKKLILILLLTTSSLFSASFEILNTDSYSGYKVHTTIESLDSLLETTRYSTNGDFISISLNGTEYQIGAYNKSVGNFINEVNNISGLSATLSDGNLYVDSDNTSDKVVIYTSSASLGISKINNKIYSFDSGLADNYTAFESGVLKLSDTNSIDLVGKTLDDVFQIISGTGLYRVYDNEPGKLTFLENGTPLDFEIFDSSSTFKDSAYSSVSPSYSIDGVVYTFDNMTDLISAMATYYNVDISSSNSPITNVTILSPDINTLVDISTDTNVTYSSVTVDTNVTRSSVTPISQEQFNGLVNITNN